MYYKNFFKFYYLPTKLKDNFYKTVLVIKKIEFYINVNSVKLPKITLVIYV